jgi:hypothetical protein
MRTAEEVAEQGEDERSQACTEAGVERERAGTHAGEAGRDGDEVIDGGGGGLMPVLPILLSAGFFSSV